MSSVRENPARLRICLVLLVVLPQATLAAFVPAAPHIAEDLATSPATVDRSMVVYMAGYAVAMAAAGGLASRLGLRPVQLGALALHVVASVAVVTSPDALTLTVARALQALGCGAGTVLARVYVQEALPERERLPALTQLSTAIALTPALTPPVVGLLVDQVPWRPVLSMLGVLGAGILVLAHRSLPRSTGDTAAEGKPGLREALARPAYWWFTAAICLAWCVYFTFTTYSSHTLQVDLGTSSTVFSLLYSLVVLGYIAGSRIARRMSDRYGLAQILRVSGVLALAATCAMAAVTWLVPRQPLTLAVPMAVAMIGVGAAFPVCQAGMLRSVGPGARSASGLFFFLQMTSGAVYTGLLSLADPTSPQALSLAVLAPAVALAALVTALRPGRSASPAEDAPASAEEAPTGGPGHGARGTGVGSGTATVEKAR